MTCETTYPSNGGLVDGAIRRVVQEWGSGQNQVQLRKLNERMVPFASVGEAARARPGVQPVIAPEPGTEQQVPARIRSTFSSGQWTVGKDITTGTYRTINVSNGQAAAERDPELVESALLPRLLPPIVKTPSGVRMTRTAVSDYDEICADTTKEGAARPSRGHRAG